MKCFSCGIDPDTDELISSLFCIECTNRMAVVCHECFHRLQPDMWIDERCWELLNPVRPYDSLPAIKNFPVEAGERDNEKWNPRNYDE